MGDLRRLLLAGALVCSSCAGISLDDEVTELKSSSGSFSESLRALSSSKSAAIASSERAFVEQALMTNSPIQFSTRCRSSAADARKKWDAVLTAAGESGYRAAEVDRAYREIHMVPLCEVDEVSNITLAPVRPLPAATGTVDAPVTAGVDDLDGASRALDRYVRALADLTSNTSGRAKDEARDGIFSAGGSLLTALGVPLAAPIAGVLGQVVASIEQAERNRRIAEYLQAYDRIMPHLMERMGQAGRLANFELLSNHAIAAEALALAANQQLGPPASRRRQPARSPHERLAVYDFYSERIAAQNSVIDGLRRADPMRSARAFAAAHHALTVAYVSRRANLASLSDGLHSLSEAAGELRAAIDEARED